jgi:hypothetical protein
MMEVTRAMIEDRRARTENTRSLLESMKNMNEVQNLELGRCKVLKEGAKYEKKA